MTGLYPSRHGVFNNVATASAIRTGLAAQVGTFGEALKSAGYRMAYTGKWHVTNEEGPADRGFEELEISAGKGTHMEMALPQAIAWARSASQQPLSRGEIARPGWNPFANLYGSGQSAVPSGIEDTYDWKLAKPGIDILPSLAASGQPWMLFIGVIGPHDPYRASQRHLARYQVDSIPLPASHGDALADKPRIYQRMRAQLWDQLGPEGTREAIHHYWANASQVDDIFGAVLDALDATGQAEDTVVLRTSDHGDYAGAHGLFLKGVPAFREAYHIPLIARWPRGIANPGSSIDEFVTLADLAPTFLELAGLAPGARLTGRSLLPFFAGRVPADWPDEVHAQFNGVELYYTQRSVATKQWKYVYNGFDFDELYDLAADPHEMINLSASKAHQDIKRSMVARMWQLRRARGRPAALQLIWDGGDGAVGSCGYLIRAQAWMPASRRRSSSLCAITNTMRHRPAWRCRM